MTTDDENLSELIRQHATRYAASDQLRAGVRAQIAIAAAGSGASNRRRLVSDAAPRWLAALGGLRGSGWRIAAIGFALGAISALVIVPLWHRFGLNDSLGNAVVSDHVRALQSGASPQIASSDRHTVKPWFQGKVDYAPTVIDLQSDGFPLTGGRIEHVGGKPVAVLTYMRHRHIMSLFVWPAERPLEPMIEVVRGFNLAHWADTSMQYWLVSDAERAEVETFIAAWRAREAVK